MFGCALTVYTFVNAEFTGPALAKTGLELIDACRGSLLVSAAWWVIYYNYIGCQVMAIFGKNVCRAFPPEPVFARRHVGAHVDRSGRCMERKTSRPATKG